MYNTNQFSFMRGGVTIKKIGEPLVLDKKVRLWTLSAFLTAPLLPEYLAPLTTLAAFYFFVQFFRSAGKKIIFEKQQILMLIFICWQFIGIFRSNNTGSSVIFSLLWLFMFLGFLLVANVVDSKEQLKQVLFAVTLCGGAVGSVAVGQIFLYHYGGYIAEPLRTLFNPFWGRLDLFIAKLAVEHILPGGVVDMLPRLAPLQAIDRANATFTNPNFLAFYLVMVLPMAVYCFSRITHGKKKIVSLLCIITIVGGIAGSYSRMPYLAVIVTVFVMLFMGWKYAVTILAASPVFLFIFPSGVYKRLLTLLNFKDESVVTRAKIWEACGEMLRKKWVWGMGPGVGNVRDILISQYGIHQPHAHNLFIQLFLEGGIFGVSVFALIVLWILFDMIVLCFRSKEGRPLAVAIIASLAGLLTCGITDYVLYGPKILQFFMMLLGLALAVKKIYPATQKKHKTNSTTLSS